MSAEAIIERLPLRQCQPLQTARSRLVKLDETATAVTLSRLHRGQRMAEASDKPLIYVSYSHKDAKWFSYVMPYLEIAARAVDAEIWADRELSGGDDWRAITDSKLRACRVFVLLVSPRSSTSEVIAKELAAVLQRERNGEPVVIFPIVVSPTAEISSHPVSEKVLRPPNGKALSTFTPGQRNRQMEEIAKEIAAIITKNLPSLESQGPEPAPEPTDAANPQLQPIVLVAIIAHDRLFEADGMEFLNAVLHRLTYDYSLTRLLCVNHNPGSNQPDPNDSETAAFPETRLEAAAIYDFNRIMWEPGFPTQNPAPAPAA